MSKQKIKSAITDKENKIKYIFYTKFPDFNWKLYLCANLDLKLIFKNEIQCIKHFENFGHSEKRIYSIKTFYFQYKDFDWKIYLDNNLDLKKKLTTEIQAIIHFCDFGINENRIYSEKQLKFEEVKKDKTIIIDDKPSNNVIKSLKDYINKYKIKQLYISDSLKHFERFRNIYGLSEYKSKTEPTIFFGLYSSTDIKKITTHQENKFCMFGGTDIDMFTKFVPDLNSFFSTIKKVFAISENIFERLNKISVNSHLVNFNLVDKNIFSKISNFGNKIYIYNGYTEGNEHLYGKKIYEQVMKELPEYEYILSNKLKLSYESMPKIYSECFIGLRLTEKDGNANTVQEFETMGIPIIHNLSNCGLKWKDLQDVISIIKKYDNLYKVNKQTNIFPHDKYNSLNIKQFDFYDGTINGQDLADIYNNIDTFMNLISDYKKILLICGDYPGYGGAATNCDNIQKFLNVKNFNTYAVYFNYENETNIKLESTDSFKCVMENNLYNSLLNINFSPDLIILKSVVNVEIKKIFKCPIYYLIGGIFLNSLDKYYNTLEEKELSKHINFNVINQIKKCDYSFSNSSHTKNILAKYYNLETHLFYSSFVPFYRRDIIKCNNFGERKYVYGLVVSNFLRPIKNVKKSIEFLKDKQDVILIGKNSSIYKNYGFKCVDLISKDQMYDYYKEIQYIIQDSFYESCSNVQVESFYYGCINISCRNNFEICIKKLFDYKNFTLINKLEDSKYENYLKVCNFFNDIGINVNYILLSNKTQFLNYQKNNIKILDYTKRLHISEYANTLLKKNNFFPIIMIKNTCTQFNQFDNLKKMFLDTYIYNLNFEKYIMDNFTNKKIIIFINYENQNVPYGGGNQFVEQITSYLNGIEYVKVTFDLIPDINIYFLIDIRQGKNKKYSFEQILHHKNISKGKIIYRINDCDFTRDNKTLEKLIIKHIDNIDYFVFNSDYIKKYYCDKYSNFLNKPYKIIYNTANSEYFYPVKKSPSNKIKIVTHHWSDNINKGYDYYYKLYEYAKTSNEVEFVFIGNKFNSKYENVPVQGPYKGLELGNKLRDFDIYITASVHDSCPMHVLEGLSCGLPILYINSLGGGKDICELGNKDVGIKFSNFDELCAGIKKIQSNYDYYVSNIYENLNIYNGKTSNKEYLCLFIKIIL